MKKIYFLLLTLLLTQGCSPKKSKISVNEEIDIHLRNEIEKLNKNLLKIAISNNLEAMKKIINLEENKEKVSIEDFLKDMHKYIKDDNYTILDEYYIKNNSSLGNFDTLYSKKEGIDNYKIRYLKASKETFISLFLVDSFGEKILITVMYGKYLTGWGINNLQVGAYTASQKIAPELYIESKKELEKGNLINSASMAWFAMNKLNPAANYFEYSIEKEIKNHYDNTLSEIKIAYPLPLILESIENKPVIFDFYPELVDARYAPVFRYLSKIDIKDTLSLKEENNQVHAIMKDIFKGVDKGSENIAYKVLNRFPNSESDRVDGYGFYRKNE